MDLVGDIVRALRTGRPVARRLAWDGPWGQRFEPVPGAAGVQVVVRGGGWLLTEGQDAVPLRPGDVLLLVGGTGYALADSPATPLRPCVKTAGGDEPANGGGNVVLCGAYELRRAHPLFAELDGIVHLPGLAERDREVAAVAGLLEAELARDGAGVGALLELLLLFVLREHLPATTAFGDPVVRAALAAIHAEPGRAWTVAELATEGGLSRAPFARRFTAAVGRAPLAYVTWWRMTLAAQAIAERDVPLRVVAREAGYGSEFAFSAAFKRHFGLAPSHYRDQPTEA